VIARMPARRSLAALGAGLAMALSLAACATGGRVTGQMHYGELAVGPGATTPQWPDPPDAARYRYAGVLLGEQNFRRSESGSRLQAFGRWLAGLDGSGERRVVLQRPAAVLGDDRGRVYVSDASRAAVFVFDEAGEALHVWQQAEGVIQLVSPSGLALSGTGGLFVADADLGAVFELDATGQHVATLGRGMLKRPTGLARDAATGWLYVADTEAHDIKVFDAAGVLLQVLGRRGTALGEFNYPSHLALSAGRLLVTDTMNSRIQVFDAGSFQAVGQFGQRGLVLGNLVRPKGVSVDSEGNVYVVESYFDRLLVYNPGGELLLSLGGAGGDIGPFHLPSGVWIDRQDRVHVADMFNGRVVRLQFLGGGS
jgi:DNA-binding beta-propeller fold protein YncE